MAGDEMDPLLPVNQLTRLEQLKFAVDDDGNVIIRTSAKGTFKQTGLTVGGKITAVTVNNTSWTPIPPTALLGRNTIAIQNKSGGSVYINFDNLAPSPLVDPDSSWELPTNSSLSYGITDSIPIYVWSVAATAKITTKELA